MVCLYLFHLLSSFSSLVVSPSLLFHLPFFSSVSSVSFVFFFSLLDAVSQKKPLTFHNVSIFFASRCSFKHFSHVEQRQHLKNALNCSEERKRWTRCGKSTVPTPSHTKKHVKHVLPSFLSPLLSFSVLSLCVMLCCVWECMWCLCVGCSVVCVWCSA